MCGFAGFIKIGSFNETNDQILNELKKMNNAIAHRGPDSSGYWQDSKNGVALGHRRLSILDLSAAGNQPMTSLNQRFIICFNGEIYNHMNIRKQLENENCKLNWNSSSDTETLLAGFDIWGIEKTISKSIGMFALVVWDKKNRELNLIRDRIGEKPLYYGWQGKKKEYLLFGSELKALKQHVSFNAVIDKKALDSYFKYKYVPAPLSIYKDIFKLLPGSILKISLKNYEIEIVNYWNSEKNILKKKTIIPDNFVSCCNKLDAKLNETIVRQTTADVPVGVFLSSGVDSSLVASIMQSNCRLPINTFTIGFEDDYYDEGYSAKKIANYLNTNHNSVVFNIGDLTNLISNIPNNYDEPFSDVSQIPTLLISQIAKEKVTVCLSGDGADEIFGGYNRYQFTEKYWSFIEKLPLSIRGLLSNFIKILLYKNKFYLNKFLPRNLISQNYDEKLIKLANSLNQKNIESLYDSFISNQGFSKNLNYNDKYNESKDENIFYGLEKYNLSNFEKMMFIDMKSYLPDDILVKLDRASMSNSLECRCPFLDHEIIKFAWNMPRNYKIKNGNTKIILKELLNRYLPQKLITKKKMGFTIPLNKYLQSSLKKWAEELIISSKIKSEEFIDFEIVQKKWLEHQNGLKDWSADLWTILIFLSWHSNQ